jgi:hypothetical protein
MIYNQVTFRCLEFGIEGKLIAIGYNPFWTSRKDTKIDKLELSFLGNNGRMVPLVLNNVVNFELYPKEGRRNKKYRINYIELFTLIPPAYNSTQKDLYERVKLEVIYDD